MFYLYYDFIINMANITINNIIKPDGELKLYVNIIIIITTNNQNTIE